jgi:transcriptional regulator of acetoin/glycerol metabolism
MNRPLITIDSGALKKLEEFSFPGNIRELENMIERAIVVGNGRKITLRDLPLGKETVSTTVESLEDLEKGHICHILDKYNWNISAAAKALQVDRVTLYNKIKKYELSQK